MGRDELKWCQLTHNQLMSPQGPHFCAHSTAKTNNTKSQEEWHLLVKVMFLDKTHLKKLMKIMNNRKNQWFFAALEIDFRYETKARKVMLDFKFDALYR